MRAISELAPAADTIRRREFRAQGFEEAQIDIQADGNDAVLDIRNGGLRGARHLAKLFLAELLSHPSGTKDGPGVFWLENPGTLDGADWPHHRMLSDVSMRVMMLDLVDLYGTGSVDVVVAEERTGVVVLEAPSGDKTQTWSATHLRCDESSIEIGTTVKSVTAGDLDGDGAPELVISCEDATDEKLGVFYLRRDPSQPWTAQCDPIDVAGQDGAKFDLVRVADVDGDGAFDIVTSEEGLGEDVGLGVVWYRNPS